MRFLFGFQDDGFLEMRLSVLQSVELQRQLRRDDMISNCFLVPGLNAFQRLARERTRGRSKSKAAAARASRFSKAGDNSATRPRQMRVEGSFARSVNSAMKRQASTFAGFAPRICWVVRNASLYLPSWRN